MICWIDLETTGLNSRLCSIIELACVITDDQFNDVASYETLIRPPRNAYVETGAYEMHKKSGLWKLAKEAPVGGITRLERELSDLLSKTIRERSYTEEKLVLAGSSVHFDRAFIEHWLPKSASYLHYRNFDVSSLKQFCQFAYGADPDDLPGRKSDSKHRAMDDIRVSIEGAKWYRENLLYLPDVKSMWNHSLVGGK